MQLDIVANNRVLTIRIINEFRLRAGCAASRMIVTKYMDSDGKVFSERE